MKSIRSKRKQPWEVTLGAAIRARRKALKLTQLDLAALANCGPAFLYQLETGKRSVRLEKVIEVSTCWACKSPSSLDRANAVAMG